MKVLVIGGTKFIGKAIVESVKTAGHEIVLFNRGQTQPSLNFKLIQGDVEEISNFKKQLLEQNFDIVIHCIAYTQKHAQDIVSIFKNTSTKIIVLSSCDCYEVFQGLSRKVDKAELPIRENSQLSEKKYYWSDSTVKGASASTYDKNLMTDVLMSQYQVSNFNVTVFRLPMVYGPGDSQYPNRHGAFIKRILDKKEDILLSDREQCQIYTYGYVDNISAAIVHCFGKEVTNGKIYNLGEMQSRTHRRWAQLYAQIAGRTFRFHILPEELLRKDISYRNAPPMHLLVDSTLYQTETGFVEPIELKESIKRTFNYAVEHPDVLGPSDDYEQEQALCNQYYSFLDSIL